MVTDAFGRELVVLDHAARRTPVAGATPALLAELVDGPPELRVIERLHGLLLRVFRRLPTGPVVAAVHTLTPSYNVGADLRDRARRRAAAARAPHLPQALGLPGGLLKRGEDAPGRGAAGGAGGGRPARSSWSASRPSWSSPTARRVDVIFAARPAAGADPDDVRPRSPEIVECRWFPARRPAAAAARDRRGARRAGPCETAGRVGGLPRPRAPPRSLHSRATLGWRSFLSALASIWRMRSRVRSKASPTSASVRGPSTSSPKRSARTARSRSLSRASCASSASRSSAAAAAS